METPFKDKNILIGITGSIAAYKTVDLASKLSQQSVSVNTILTQASQNFISPLTFQSVTGNKAYTDTDMWNHSDHILHVALTQEADLFLIAPITANTIAKFSHGLADNLLTLSFMASKCPVILAPAMDSGMFQNEATQENLGTLRKRGISIVGPSKGHLASGQTGFGRMIEIEELLGHIRLSLAENGLLNDHKIVVTAGGTSEPLDPVRIFTNRSSGKQGFAIAQAALDLGADVVLINARSQLPTPFGAKRININTSDEMLKAVLEETPNSDALIMSAAVTDFKVENPFNQKIKKDEGTLKVTLETTPDILSIIADKKKQSGYPRYLIGFAAESQDLLNNARKKMRGKNLDMIIANNITTPDSGFESDDNQVTILDPSGGKQNLPLMNKLDVAIRIMERVTKLIHDN